jgi:TDG/mug DNA glycosylase family protein
MNSGAGIEEYFARGIGDGECFACEVVAGTIAPMPLRDILAGRPRVLFVGINPSLRSEQVGHHFAGPGNPFWRLLHEARIVPVALSHMEDERLAEFGLALTNLCARATRSADELRADEMERGRKALARKIGRVRPEVVAFVGVSIYRLFFGKGASGGAGPKPEKISGASVFVLPNPSGLNASFPGFKDKLIWFQQLRDFIDLAGGETLSPQRSKSAKSTTTN